MLGPSMRAIRWRRVPVRSAESSGAMGELWQLPIPRGRAGASMRCDDEPGSGREGRAHHGRGERHRRGDGPPAEGGSVSTIEVSTEELVARAAGLRERLYADADEAEERGGYSPEMHQAFVDAGFYRMLQPRMFGGYEMALADYFRVIIEIGRGDPQTGWALCLAAGHAFQIGAFFGEPARSPAARRRRSTAAGSSTAPGTTARARRTRRTRCCSRSRRSPADRPSAAW